MKKADLICAVIGMLFSSGTFIITFGFKKFKNVPVGPEFFPRYLSVGLFICCAVLFIQSATRPPANDRAAPSINPLHPGMRRLLAGLGIIVAYTFAWDIIGFPIATPLGLCALMFLLGVRKYPLMAFFSLGTTAVVFGAFKFLLGIDMPLGFLENIMG